MAEFEGLYVTIGGDTVEFEKSIGGVNKALGSLKKEMGNLNKELKLDPNNIDLLNQKLGNLEQQSHLAGQKILELKAKQEALGEGEVGSAQWKDLELQINRVQLEMNALDSAAATTRNAIEEAGDPGSVTNLNAALEDVGSQLELVNDKLALDPSNVELSEEKARLLERAIELATQKIERLREEQANLGEANIGTPEWRDLERQIVDTQGEIAGFTSELNTIDDNNSELETTNKLLSFETLGNAADKLAEVGDALKGVAEDAIESWGQMDDTLDGFTKRTGISGDAIEDMIGKIVGKLPVQDFEELGSIAGELFSTMGVAPELAQPLVESFWKLGQVTGTDAVNGVKSLHQIQQQYNLSVDDTDMMLGKMTDASQLSGLSFDDLAKSLITGSEEAQQLGIGFDGMLSIMLKANNAGVDYDTVLKGLSKASTTFAKDGKSLSQGLEELSTSYNEATSDADKLNIVAEVFGSKNAPAINKALQEGKISLTDFGDTADLSGTQLNDTFEATLDPIDEYQVAQNKMTLGMADLGGLIQDTLAPAFTKISDVVGKVVEWFSNLDPRTRTIIVVIGLLVIGLGILIPVIMSIIATVGGLATSLGALNIALLPIIGVVAAVVAGIVILIAIILNWGAITDWIKEKWGVVKQFFSTLWANIVTYFTTAFSNIQANVISFVSNVVSNVSNFVNNVINFFKNLGSNIVSTVSSFISNVISFFSNLGSNIISIVSGFISSVISFFSNLRSNLISIVSGLWSNVVNFFSNGVSNVISTVSNIGSRIAGFFAQVPSMITNAIGDLSYIGSGIVSSIINGLGNLGSMLLGAIRNAISSLPNIMDLIGSWFKGSINLDSDPDGYGGVASQLFNIKGFNLPNLEGIGSSKMTTLNINVTANTSNGLDIAKAIERRLVRSLNGR